MKLYHLYGLAVTSDFICPELTEITPEQAVARKLETVRLIRGDVPPTLPEGRQIADWMWITSDMALYLLDGIARIRVDRPDCITVDMVHGAAESDMRAYLFGTGFGTLLHMRRLIPLHISALQAPEGVVAFTGPSGAGKSTKAAEMHFLHGWSMICDDVAVLHPTDDEPLLHSGVNRIRLWKDAVLRFGMDPETLIRDLHREDKFHILLPDRALDRPLPMRRLMVLQPNRDTVAPMTGEAIVTELMNAVYRPELAALFNDRGAIFLHLARMAALINAPPPVSPSS
ncbi:MAG: hypothetical protein ACK4RZ_04615 [Paracoccaceae bacterium]